MLTLILTCMFALTGQVAQPQDNSGTQSADPPPMSLAERAAAARKPSAARASHGETSRSEGPPPLTPEQRGTVQGNAYVNDALHFRIALTQWQPLTAERMALDEDTARRLVNPNQQASSPYRVLWVGDTLGRNVALAVIPLPPQESKDIKQLNERMKKIAISQLATATELTESEESFLLGDAMHPFAGFRVASIIQGQHLVQSSQLTLVNGLLNDNYRDR